MGINDIINSCDLNLMKAARAKLNEAIKTYYMESLYRAINEARDAGFTIYVTTHQTDAGEIIIDDDDRLEIELTESM